MAVTVSNYTQTIVAGKGLVSNEWKLIVSNSYREASERAAILVASRIFEKPDLNLAVSVGMTPIGTYEHLTNLSTRQVVDLSNCHFLLMDEFFSSKKETKGPHLKDMSHTLFNPANIPREHIHVPEVELSPEQALSSFTELSSLHPIDLVLCHCGEYGNIGWIYYTQKQVTGPTIINLDGRTDQESLGYDTCISLGLENLLQAKELIIFAFGLNKAHILKDVFNDTKQSTTVSYLLANHPRVLFFVDREAASLLDNNESTSSQRKAIKGFDIIDDPHWRTNERIICVSPHPDDTSISAGATLSFLSKNNTISSVIATTGHRAYIANTTPEERIKIREEEAREEAAHLGAKVFYLRLPLYHRSRVEEDDIRIVSDYLQNEKPHVIFLPHTGDAHPTHRAVLQAFLLALKSLKEKGFEYGNTIMMFEGPWSLFSKGSYNTVCSPPKKHFAKKLAAIRAHKSQIGRTPYDRAAESLAQLRGALVPEQDLSGFGAEPPKLEERVELFYQITIKSTAQIDRLLDLFQKQLPPSRDAV